MRRMRKSPFLGIRLSFGCASRSSRPGASQRRAASGLPAATESDCRHPRRSAAADRRAQPRARRRRAARASEHADHRRALATRAAAGGPADQSKDERTASVGCRRLSAISQFHDQDGRRRVRAESDAPAISVAGVDRLLARRQALRVHAASRQRHRAVDRRYRLGTGQVGHDGAVERGVGNAVRMGWRRRVAAVRVRARQPRRGANRRRANRPEHPGASRRHRARPHLRGPACQRARRSALRLLRHQPARVRRRRQRSTHRRRHAHRLRYGGAFARRPVHSRPSHTASVFLARAVQEFSGECRGVESAGRARSSRSRSCRLPTTSRTAA